MEMVQRRRRRIALTTLLVAAALVALLLSRLSGSDAGFTAQAAGTGSASSDTTDVITDPGGSGNGSAGGSGSPGSGGSAGSGSDGGAGSGPARTFSVSGDVQGLYPGSAKPLVLTFGNPNDAAIRVVRLAITVSTSPQGCPAHLLSFTPIDPVPVPAHGTATGSVTTHLSASAGESCRGVRWSLAYSGTAVGS